MICTFNRASTLKDTLESFLKIELPTDVPVELLVVDNNSSDETPLIARTFADRHSNVVRVVREPRSGLSYARNTGIKAAKGDIIAFADDDVYFDSKWVIELASVFGQDPEAYCMGGKSIPLFEDSKPEWLSPSLLPLYSCANSGDEVKIMQYPEYPFGVNMAFRRKVFDIIGTFDTSLGRIGSSLLSGEEADLFYRISRAGLKTVYTPHAIVHHRIPRARTEKKYVLRRNYWQGISNVVFRQLYNPAPKRELARAAIWEVRSTVRVLIRTLCRLISPRDGDPTPTFLEWVSISKSLGVARQSLREILSPTSSNDRQGECD